MVLTYVTALILLTVFIGLVLRTARVNVTPSLPWVTATTSALLAFVAGGFSTMIVAAQGLFILLAMTATWRFASPAVRRSLLPVLLAGLVGSGLSLLVQITAPGTAIRQAHFPDPTPLLQLALMNGVLMASFLVIVLVIFSPMEILIALVVPGIMVNQTQYQPPIIQAKIKRHARSWLALALGIGLLWMYGIFLPATYNLSNLPPARALIIPEFVLMGIAMSWGIIMGISLQKPQAGEEPVSRLSLSRTAAVVLALLLFVGPIRSTWNTLSLVPKFSTFAAEWENRDRELRAAAQDGTMEVVLQPFSVDMANYANVETADNKPGVGVNACIARYYGLDSVTVPQQEVADKGT